jgi:hypothetical protein
VNAAVLNPRAATAAAIAHSLMPYETLCGPQLPGPTPEAVRDLAHDRFRLDLSDSEIRDAIKAATGS